jgi:DNA-binding MarR family transcriptional regulator
VSGDGPDGGAEREPRWLDAREAATWRSFLAAQLLLEAELDRQLRRDAGMSHDYYGMLAQLSEAPGRALRMGDLAGRSASSSSRVSHAVASMERLGWLRRETSSEDRRLQLAVLTDAGFAALAAAAPGHVECVRTSLFDLLTDEQVDQLRAISETVVGRLAAPGSRPFPT